MIKRAKGKPVISEFTEEVLPMWTPSKLIRNKATGRPYKVIHVYSSGLTLVITLDSREEFVTPIGIPEREYYKYTLDTNEENTDPVNYEGTWYEHQVRI